MTGRILARVLLVTCLAMAFAAPLALQAQFGGLGRRISEAAKKAAGGDAGDTATPADTPAAPTPVVLPTDDPAVIPITDAVLVAFAKGLQTELDLRDEFRKELAAMKTPEEFAACSQQAASSPEFLETLMQLGNLPENASPDVMQKAMNDMAQNQQALLTKTCGEDPGKINRSERLRDIQRKAAAAATPLR